MVGEDPDLSVKRVVYLPRWSFEGNSSKTDDARRLGSVESDIGLQNQTSGLSHVRSEVSRDSASIVNSFIHEDVALPQLTGTSALVASEDEEAAANLVEQSTAQQLNGFALYLLVMGLMMAAFLLMIDSTILVTVGDLHHTVFL